MKLTCPSGEAITLTADQVQRSRVLRASHDEGGEVMLRCTPQTLRYLNEFLQYPVPTRQRSMGVHQADSFADLFGPMDRKAVDVIARVWAQNRTHFFDLLNASNFLDLACMQDITTVQLAYALAKTPKDSWLRLVSEK